MDLRNVGILPQHYTASQPRRWRQHGPLKRWYPTTTLHGVTILKTTWTFTNLKTLDLTIRKWKLTSEGNVKQQQKKLSWSTCTVKKPNHEEWCHKSKKLQSHEVKRTSLQQRTTVNTLSGGSVSFNSLILYFLRVLLLEHCHIQWHEMLWGAVIIISTVALGTGSHNLLVTIPLHHRLDYNNKDNQI